MARTVGVVRLIGAGATPEASSVVRLVELTMALHDVGNAVKFNVDEEKAIEMLGEPSEQLSRWRLYTDYMRSRYGEDDHAATEAILTELGIRAELIELVSKKSSRHFDAILRRRVPAEMLALYADMRVAPSRVVSIEERYLEATKRYADSGRVGLGGTVEMGHLNELESAVSDIFDSNLDQLTAAKVDALLADSLALPLDEAFADA